MIDVARLSHREVQTVDLRYTVLGLTETTLQWDRAAAREWSSTIDDVTLSESAIKMIENNDNASGVACL